MEHRRAHCVASPVGSGGGRVARSSRHRRCGMGRFARRCRERPVRARRLILHAGRETSCCDGRTDSRPSRHSPKPWTPGGDCFAGLIEKLNSSVSLAPGWCWPHRCERAHSGTLVTCEATSPQSSRARVSVGYSRVISRPGLFSTLRSAPRRPLTGTTLEQAWCHRLRYSFQRGWRVPQAAHD